VALAGMKNRLIYIANRLFQCPLLINNNPELLTSLKELGKILKKEVIYPKTSNIGIKRTKN